jgi:hypothetical protein
MTNTKGDEQHATKASDSTVRSEVREAKVFQLLPMCRKSNSTTSNPTALSERTHKGERSARRSRPTRCRTRRQSFTPRGWTMSPVPRQQQPRAGCGVVPRTVHANTTLERKNAVATQLSERSAGHEHHAHAAQREKDQQDLANLEHVKKTTERPRFNRMPWRALFRNNTNHTAPRCRRSLLTCSVQNAYHC